MGRRITVSPEYLRKASMNISREAQLYQGDYTKMYQEVDAMVNSWSGVDNQAFVSQIKGFVPELNKMYQLMQQYSNFLNQTAQVYERVQNETAAYARRLTN